VKKNEPRIDATSNGSGTTRPRKDPGKPGYRMNCGVEIFLVPPPDPKAPYQAQAIFLCADNPKMGRASPPGVAGPNPARAP
jgi:hypothetical protein